MANHKSAKKRIKSSEVKRLRNRYQHKTTRTYLKKLRESTDKVEAEKLLAVTHPNYFNKTFFFSHSNLPVWIILSLKKIFQKKRLFMEI